MKTFNVEAADYPYEPGFAVMDEEGSAPGTRSRRTRQGTP